MSIKQLAAAYLRHWNVLADLRMEPASNAAPELRRLAGEIAPEYTPTHLYEALQSLATGKPVRVPALPGLLEWLADGYDSVSYCQAAFANKRTPPKSFEDCLERAYKAAQNELVTRVHDWLNQQIADYR